MTMPSFSCGIVANETRLHHCNAPFGALRLSEESSLPNTLCVFKSSFFKSSFFFKYKISERGDWTLIKRFQRLLVLEKN